MSSAILTCLGLVLAVATPFLADSARSLEVEGRVVDDESGAPVPYVNVGVPGQAVGTVADEAGRFVLSGVRPDAEIAFSAIGFKRRTVAAEAISTATGVRLTRVEIGLREKVSVTAKAPDDPIVLGHRYEARGYGFGFASGLLGAEIGARIRIKRPTFVESANFTVAHTGGERFLYRVNIYDFSAGVVGANLLEENVLVEAEQERGTMTIDLRDQGLFVTDDVLLSLEWIRDDREVGNANVMFRAKPSSRGNLYHKLTSQMPFKKVERHRIGFFLLGHPL